MEYFAIKSWDQASGGTDQDFMIRYTSGLVIATAKKVVSRG